MTRLLIFILSFLILTRFSIDPDLGWHLAYGNHFWATGEILRQDIFSWTMEGYSWGNYFFLYQIVVAWLIDAVGYLATVFVFGFLASVAVLVLVGLKLDFFKIIAIVLGLGILSASLGIRPLMFSLFLFSGMLFLLERRFFMRWWQAVFWFAFFALWANLHQGFLVGLLVFGGYILVDWMLDRKLTLAKATMIFGAFLGTLATPFGVELYRGIVLDLVGTQTWFSIAEYQPIVVWFPLNLLYGASGMVLIATLLKIKKLGREFIWFLLGVFLFSLGFLGTNFSVFWAAMFIFIVSRYLDFKLKLEGDFLTKLPFTFACFVAAAALTLTFLVKFLESRGLEQRLVLDGYPVEALSFMQENSFLENLFNDYAWGGYILWQSNIAVFIDGRMTGWRDGERYILSDYLAILRGDCSVASPYDIKTVLIANNYKSECFADFRQVYKDDIAQVLVRD